MMIIGCDFHTRYQQIAMMEEATGELTERRLDHESGEPDALYHKLQGLDFPRPSPSPTSRSKSLISFNS